VVALHLPDSYYAQLAADYLVRRDYMMESLKLAGFRPYLPRGAYYVITDTSGFGFKDDLSLVHHLIETIGVAAVPGSSFYARPEGGAQQIRFCFCKKYETLEAARSRLLKLQ
jgi:aminotransferase